MTGSLQRICLWLLSGLFVTAIANAAARLTWTLAGQTGVAVSEIAVASAATGLVRQPDLSPILALAPFGSAASAPAPEPTVRETSLDLVLRGVVMAEPRQDSIAVVALKDGAAKLYGVGDSIEGKAVVKEILADRILVQVGDAVETLSFPKPGEAGKAGVARLVAGITNSGIPGATGSVGASAGAAAPKPAIEEYRRRIALNPKAVLDSFGVSVSENGYTIDPNATSSVLRAGFKPGDLISRVNGEAVGDIERDRRLIDSVIAQGRVRVEVVRDGKTVVMSFPLQ